MKYEKLVEEVDKMRQENAELKRNLLEMVISSDANKMTSVRSTRNCRIKICRRRKLSEKRVLMMMQVRTKMIRRMILTSWMCLGTKWDS